MENKKDWYVSKELELAIFCIEKIAIKLNTSGQDVYKMLTEETNILNNYIIPCYDVLHTQDKNYIVDDVIEVMKENSLL